MPRSRAAYPPEFRQKMVELVGAGRSPEELAKEFEPTAPRRSDRSDRLFSGCGMLVALPGIGGCGRADQSRGLHWQR